jgi:FolB domain-containing protein
MDKIFIHALKTEAIIGIFDWERQVKQTVLIDIEMSADIRKAALTDSIDDTLNYKRSRSACWPSSRSRSFIWWRPWPSTSPC